MKGADLLYSNLNDGKKCTSPFIDFQKAFDLVNHKLLLKKLEAIGVRGVALNWFHSFLEGRKQRVQIKNARSSLLTIRSGVPQGSVLAATLFLVFINDLLNLPLNGKPSAFADDIALFLCRN